MNCSGIYTDYRQSVAGGAGATALSVAKKNSGEPNDEIGGIKKRYELILVRNSASNDLNACSGPPTFGVTSPGG